MKNEKVITDKENQTKYKKQNSCYDVHLFYAEVLAKEEIRRSRKIFREETYLVGGEEEKEREGIFA